MQQRFPLSDSLEVFLLDRKAQNLADKTLKTYQTRLTIFVNWCSEQSVTYVDQITSTHIRQYQAGLVKTLKDVSAKNRMVDIKTFLRFCVDERFITASPADRVKLPRVVDRLPEVLTTDEVKRIFKSCETDRDRAVFLVMLDTGVRAEEFCNMDVEDININDGVITVREGKPRRDRHCYISARTSKDLLKYIRSNEIEHGPLWLSERTGERLTESGVGQLLKRLQEQAGIDKLTPHKIRKTFVTTMLRSGVDVFTLKKLSGHRSLEALKPYVEVADMDAKQAHKGSSPVNTLLN